MKNDCRNVGKGAKRETLKRRVRVEIDLGALVRNYRKIVAHVKPMRVLSVLKANAYGLGVGAYAKALAEAGCREFGVAEPFEALELLAVLKRGGFAADVQILSSILPDEIAPMVKTGVILPITDVATAKLISDAARRAKKTARVHFKLDTGMGRLGILAKDALETIRAVRKLPNLDCEGIFSHCPMAYDPKDPFTKRQIKLFKSIVASCAKEGIAFRKVHMAASDAINNFPETFTAASTRTAARRLMSSRSSPCGRASRRCANCPRARRSATGALGASRSRRRSRRSRLATPTGFRSRSRTAATSSSADAAAR